MAYTKTGPFTDYSGSPGLSATFANGVESALVGALTFLWAPAPSGDTSGATDQVALQALVSSAQSTSGTLVLQAGTYYVTGLTTAQSFAQPIIRGVGQRKTTITVVGTGAAITYVGGSGQPSGGVISDMAITSSAGGGVGVMLAGPNNVDVERVYFTALAEGVQFHNRDSGSFTEFCRAVACTFATDVTTPVHYKKTSGGESFHGTGLDGGCVVNQSATATTPVITIDQGCFPYGAPLNCTIFARTGSVPLIRNNDTAGLRQSEFRGNLDIEILNSATGVTIVDATTTNVIFLAGTCTALGSTGLTYGGLQVVDRTYYSNSSVTVRGKPATTITACTTGANVIGNLRGNVTAFLAAVTVKASNYYYEYTLIVTRDSFSSNGWVTTVANPQPLNTAGYGPPTFTVSNYQLNATNASWPASGVTTTATLTVIGYPDILN